MPPVERRYRILGRSVALVSDESGFIRLFDKSFGLFRCSRPSPRKPPTFDSRISVLLRANPPRLEIKRGAAASASPPKTIALPATQPDFLQTLVLREIFAGFPDFLFLHAAVAVRDGAALLVSGPSGAGKTTLLLQLARRGFTVYSDEFAPVDLKSGQVSPFPRAIAVKRKGRGLGEQKHILAPSALSDVGAPPVPIRLAAFLETAPNGVESPGSSVLIREEAVPLFLSRIKPIPSLIVKIEGTGYSAVNLPSITRRADRLRVVKALNDHRESVLNIYEPRGRRGLFSLAPQIRPIPPAEASGLFLANLLDSSNPLATERPGAAFFRICRILKDTVQLSVRSGTPPATARALLAVWDAAVAGDESKGGG